MTRPCPGCGLAGCDGVACYLDPPDDDALIIAQECHWQLTPAGERYLYGQPRGGCAAWIIHPERWQPRQSRAA